MFRFLSIGIDVFAAAIVLIPVLTLLQTIFCKPMPIARKMLTTVFSLYIAAVFSATGLPAFFSITFDCSLHLIPFSDIMESPFHYLENTLMNIILFLPLGFFSPLLWKKFRSLKHVVLLGFFLSAFIEIMQLFTFRLTDVDDLIINTIGTIPGYLLANFLIRKNKTPAHIGEYTAAYDTWEFCLLLERV